MLVEWSAGLQCCRCCGVIATVLSPVAGWALSLSMMFGKYLAVVRLCSYVVFRTSNRMIPSLNWFLPEPIGLVLSIARFESGMVIREAAVR
jgi:hypothetical protein